MGSTSSDCVFVTFYSDPVEAFLTSVFRALEVFDCRSAIVLSSRDRLDEVRRVIECVKNYLPSDIEIHAYPDFPPPDDLDGFNGLVEKVYNRLRNALSRRTVVVATYTGSRVEVSTTVLASSRIRESSIIIYTPFFWGPWSGLFYPFTPRPLEPVVVLHPDAESVKGLVERCKGLERVRGCLGSLGPQVLNLFSCIGRKVSRLRMEVSYEQLKMNLGLAFSPMLYPVNWQCSGVEVSIAIGDAGKEIATTIRDYCSGKDVVEAVQDLGEGFLKLVDELQLRTDGVKALDLLLKFSSVLIPVLDECNYVNNRCSDLRDLILVDALGAADRGGNILVDTNILYSSLHVQLYEHHLKSLRLPLCTYTELLNHMAHYTEGYEKLRSEIAAIAIDEVSALGIPLESAAAQQPCEIGMALARDSIAVTMDRHAYEGLFKRLGVEAILSRLRPIKSVRFVHRESARRISYAYYALAQLKALNSRQKIGDALREAKVRIEFRQK